MIFRNSEGNYIIFKKVARPRATFLRFRPVCERDSKLQTERIWHKITPIAPDEKQKKISVKEFRETQWVKGGIFGDFIQDDDAPAPVDAATSILLKEQLIDVLGTLTDREQKVLRLRFGLDDGRARTLEEVGKEFDVTRERIRQIEAKALRKLRHPSRSRKLKDFLE